MSKVLRFAQILSAIIIFLSVASSVLADGKCNAGNFSTINGTACSIGSLTFQFNNVSSLGGGWSASDLYFTPTASGFSLSFLGGAQALAEGLSNPTENLVFDELGLNFNVTAPQGYYFDGDGVYSTASFGASGPSAFASAGSLHNQVPEALAIICYANPIARICPQITNLPRHFFPRCLLTPSY